MLLVPLLPLVDRNAAHINFLADAGAFMLLALGLNIVVGFAGLLDLGYAAFFAIGSYSTRCWRARSSASTSRFG